ncbi:MAG: helix-turn-helix transcriptional regulator [Lachnospiraceae bacterium]|nr:helix-turn-helix transcriptional regulator [Lachnospiraceae bacterium]
MREIILSSKSTRKITLSNHNYAHEGILHPDRTLKEYDLLYMQNGKWDVYEVDDDGSEVCFSLSPGMVLLLRPDHRHYSKEPCSPEMRNLYVHFQAEDTSVPDGSLPELSDPDASSVDGLSPHPGEDSPYLVLSQLTDCRDNSRILTLLEQITETFYSDQLSHRDLMLTSLLNLTLAELDHIYHQKKSGSDVMISQILHRFHTDFDVFYSPQELADDYGVSLRTISGRFKRATGQSIHQYQMNLKLTLAYDALPMSYGRGLRDIARSYGFYDEFQFSKLFKRKFGVSPSKRMREGIK